MYSRPNLCGQVAPWLVAFRMWNSIDRQRCYSDGLPVRVTGQGQGRPLVPSWQNIGTLVSLTHFQVSTNIYGRQQKSKEHRWSMYYIIYCHFLPRKLDRLPIISNGAVRPRNTHQSSSRGTVPLQKTMSSTEKVEQDENHTFHLVSTINKLAINHQQTTALGDHPLHTH